jgi:hopanoid biosynthesis associated membrane protein HpnM
MSLVLLALAAAVSPAAAAPAMDPAAARIEAFYPVLLDSMKHAKTLGLDGRVAQLRPAIVSLFNVPVMAQFAVGPKWATMTPAEHQSITDALTRYTVRSYAKNFDSFGDEQFHVEPQPAMHGLDKLVKTTITSKEPLVTLSYRMRQYEGTWKVIDVYYNAVSQLTAQRADFASTIAAGGAAALVKKLDGQTQQLH